MAASKSSTQERRSTYGVAHPVYPGVFARVYHSNWPDYRGRTIYQHVIEFEGLKDDLIRAGIITAADRLPAGHPGSLRQPDYQAHARRNGEFKVRLDEETRGSARDLAFRRFMALVLSE